jgi:L-fuculose-phosphate aldolase
MLRRPTKANIVKEFQWVGEELMARGLLTLHAGNLSVRRDSRVFITRTGSRLGRLSAADVVETPLDPEKPRHPRASMELPAHLAIYAATGAAAIVHAHPASAIALSFVTDPIVPVDSEGAIVLGEVPVIRARQVVGSSEVARKAAAALRDHRIVVVAAHGSFAVGRSLEEALSVTTTLEMSAKIALMVDALGGPAPRRLRRKRAAGGSRR